MNWNDFKKAAPDLAKLGEERFESFGLVLVGTIRRNGWPRISPVEPLPAPRTCRSGGSERRRRAEDGLRNYLKTEKGERERDNPVRLS